MTKGAAAIRAKLKGLQSSITSVSGVMTGLLGVFGVSLGATVFVRSIRSSMDEIDKLAKASAKLGFDSPGSLQALQFAMEQTGVAADSGTVGIQRMIRRIATAAQGGGEAKKTLEDLGLSAQRLAEMTPDQQFLTLADAISKTENHGEKLRQVFTLFDSEGVSLINTLNLGSEGVKELMKEFDGLGTSISGIEASQVEMANDAMNKMDKVLQGVSQQFAIQLSPWITAIAEQFTSWATTSIDTSQTVTSSISWVVDAIGVVADVVHTVKLGFMALQIGVTTVVTGIVGVINLVGKALEGIINLLPGVEVSFTDTTQAMRDSLGSLLEDQMQTLHQEFLKEPPSTGIKRGFEGIKNKATEAATAIREAGKTIGTSFAEGAMQATTAAADLVAQLDQSIATFGMSSTEAKLWKLAQDGASQSVLDEARALQEQLDKMDEAQKRKEQMISDAESVTASVRTPFETFQMESEKLQALLNEGLISPETFKRAVNKAKEGLGKGQLSGEVKLSSANVLGSQEARSAILRHQFRMPESKDEQELKAMNVTQREQLAIQRETLKEMRRRNAAENQMVAL